MKCSEVGEAEAEPRGSESVFRVRVSLERYFSDERARCYMSVSRGRPVRSLARRLRRAFHLPRPFALLSRGHLLPPDEPLALLDPDDHVEVIPIKSTEYQVPETNGAEGCPRPEDTPPRSPHVAPAADDELDGTAQPEPVLTESTVASAAAPVEASLSPAEPALRPAASADLQDLKRRALELLDQYDAPPRRRRRARRRRVRRAPSPAALGEREPATEPEGPAVEFGRAVEEDPAMEEGPATEEGLATEERRSPAPLAVVRNCAGATSPRAARLVRPLPPAGPAVEPPAPTPALTPALV